ncbi:MAG: signal peptide peptidase SppA [Desulfovibrio sp.]|jgi:protease-4|nr:signal peptide peptidase SppA [Desulfovibrio sp.]
MSPDSRAAKKKWRKRHPFLFWGGIFLLVLAAGHAAHWAARGPLAGPRIAVVNIEGLILDAAAVTDWLETVCRDSSVRAVVVRVNSPGGGVAPSQELYRAVKRAAEIKPVVVSMGAVAASGGYYAALGGREIFANPSTLTAGIGVKLRLPNLEGLLRAAGIAEKTLSTGSLKDAGSFSRSPSPEEEAYFQDLIRDMFEEFLSAVIRERKLPPEQARALADGRAMTGRQALKAGLVDRIGDFRDALARAGELGRFPPGALPDLVTGPEKSFSLVREIFGVLLEISADRGIAAGQPVFLY